jgi:hypothetical protein
MVDLVEIEVIQMFLILLQGVEVVEVVEQEVEVDVLH